MNNLLKKSVKKYQAGQDLIYRLQKLSNQIRAGSKKAIALLRRDNIKESQKAIEKAERDFKLINKLVKNDSDLLRGFYREAVEEYIEALTFYNFLTKSNRSIPDFVKADPEEIIGGICDFTGELVRKAITIAHSKHSQEILLYKKAVEDIVEELTKIALMGKLRHKYDETERNLKRIEGVLYEIKLTKCKG